MSSEPDTAIYAADGRPGRRAAIIPEASAKTTAEMHPCQLAPEPATDHDWRLEGFAAYRNGLERIVPSEVPRGEATETWLVGWDEGTEWEIVSG